MSNLSDSQQRALDQLRELTNGASDDVSIGVLESTDWDVERAAELIFGGGVLPAPSTSSVEAFQIDDSAQRQPAQGQVLPYTRMLYVLARPLLSLLAVPLHILSSVVRFIFGVLRIPVPQFRFSSLNFYRPQPRHRPGGPDKWVRELEEELGAVCIGRTKTPRVASSTTGMQAGPSRITTRNAQSDDCLAEGKKLLPDFVISSYEQFLRTCQRELKIGCVILLTDEHDDTPEFKRATLTNSEFVKTLYNNHILVWGGDVRDLEAWNASEKLQATTYPFIAFVALQPKRTPSSSASSSRPRSSSSQQPILTVLSRHQGKPYPSSSGPTSAQTLIDHLDRQLLPRVNPFLERLRAQQREREQDRQLRAEQDRAFQEAARRDKERIEAKIAAEKAEAEAKRKAEEAERAAILKKEQEAAETRRREELRMVWRCWTRNAIAGPIIAAGGGGDFRIAIRLATGTRVVQSFPSTTSLTAFYAFVDSQLIPSHFEPKDDPVTPPEGTETNGEQVIEKQIAAAGGAASWWGFQLATAYPRIEIPWKRDVQLGEMSMLKGGGQVVVEMLGSSRSSTEDDGYKTESDEE